MVEKTPYMVVYWADTGEPLDYQERSDLYGLPCTVAFLGPQEVLLNFPNMKRMVVVRGITDPGAPLPPKPKG